MTRRRALGWLAFSPAPLHRHILGNTPEQIHWGTHHVEDPGLGVDLEPFCFSIHCWCIYLQKDVYDLAHILKRILLGQKYFLSRIQQFTLAGGGGGVQFEAIFFTHPQNWNFDFDFESRSYPALPNRNCSSRTLTFELSPKSTRLPLNKTSLEHPPPQEKRNILNFSWTM